MLSYIRIKWIHTVIVGQICSTIYYTSYCLLFIASVLHLHSYFPNCVWVCICVQVRMHVHAGVCMFMYVKDECSCMCMCTYVCKHRETRDQPPWMYYIYIYICTYIYTHIYFLFLIYILIIFPIVHVSVCAWADVCMFFSVALSWAITLDWLASKLQGSSFLNWAAISFPASPVRDSLCWTTQYWLNQSDKLLSNVDSQIVLLLREPWLLQPLLLLYRVPGLGLSLAG